MSCLWYTSRRAVSLYICAEALQIIAAELLRKMLWNGDIMKKKLIALVTSVLVMGVFAGCGKSGDTALRDMDVDKYVTLGEYKGLEVMMTPVSVDDEELDYYTNDFYQGGLVYAMGVKIDDGITDRAVELGDTVYIDYVGKKDDVAFDGGTAEGCYLNIGSGQFIDGFEDGLVGVMPGETVDLNLTFPEGYDNTELAGADVVFTVTVNYIHPEGYKDELIQAFTSAVGMADITNAEEMRQYIYDYLYNSRQQEYDYYLSQEVMNAFMNICEFSEIPQELVEKYENAARTSVESGAASIGMTEDTYAQYYYGCTMDELIESIPETVKEDIALQAVANRENLNVSDEELNETLLSYAQSYGYSTVEEYVGENSLEDYREYFMMNKVLTFLTDNAVINEQ